jgi:hypothetical protein
VGLSHRTEDHGPDGNHGSESEEQSDLSGGFDEHPKHVHLRVPMMFIIVRSLFFVKIKTAVVSGESQ